MKLLICLIITLVLAGAAQAQTPTPVAGALEAQAREELNEAARAYREGRFAEAQAHSERALLLDPQNRTAPMYIARTIHAQYKPRDFTPENVAKAHEAIAAYQRIIERSPGDDEAYKAIAYLYGAVKEDQLEREWIFRRAGEVSLSNEKRAEAYVVLASKDWDCSFKISELPTNKITTVKGDKAYVSYRMPREEVEFQRAKECANRGLELVRMAITLTPENEAAWSYRANILLELAKLAEMSGDMEQKRELHREYEAALNETTRLSNRAQPKP